LSRLSRKRWNTMTRVIIITTITMNQKKAKMIINISSSEKIPPQ